ncbi:MAG TPA: dipicolinate synthase subunit DpsA [Clostridiales bacterium]|nr:dipicolinate synthase subunit DpsA [Clostridiales bacterium]
MKDKIAVLGGALREKIVAARLQEEGFPVSVCAVEGMNDIAEATVCDCVRDATVLILPVASNDESGKIFAPAAEESLYFGEEEMRLLAEGAVIYCGVASKMLKAAAKRLNHKLVEVMEIDAVAVPNGVLTAEGTLYLAMARFPVAISELKVAVFGYGRVGKATAELFRALQAKVIVFSRNKKEIAEGRRDHIDMRFYNGVHAVLTKTDLVINTVPAIIVNEQMMCHMSKEVLLIDLAAAPGGVDREVAKERGIEVLNAPGIPGKYAPVSAGKILADFFVKELAFLKGGESPCE